MRLLRDPDVLAMVLPTVRNEERHSRGAFALRTFPGGHFFLDDHRESVVDLVRTTLAGLSPRRP
ncbi:hypothetical protein [Streptomyces kanamyceticus]|uniref:hypothetical protein n=1 Tax=Streptomyces kanamyceticus TaxID=1967 RepID=UPI0006E1DB08|nr:hypothetical protein [Streptomyces kanamyceticus]